MPEWIQFGRRHSDLGLVIDFHKKRGIVRANTAWIEGVDLEVIPSGYNDFAPGMVLIHGDWHSIYFLIERDGWNEDDYFIFAEKKFLEHGIKIP